MATSGDKYRSCSWKTGPPNYDVVNKLFEKERTNVWPAGSLEEYVQNLVKTWEMELVYKDIEDEFTTLDPKKYVLGINGNKSFSLEDIERIGGSYNVFLQSSLPPELRFFDPDQETSDSAQTAFRRVFTRGFAFEVLKVYAGPPVISYTFRHWGYFEGAYKEYQPTGKLIELFGSAIFELDEHSKIVKTDFFFDRGELLAGLLKGNTNVPTGCPFMS